MHVLLNFPFHSVPHGAGFYGACQLGSSPCDSDGRQPMGTSNREEDGWEEEDERMPISSSPHARLQTHSALLLSGHQDTVLPLDSAVLWAPGIMPSSIDFL